MDTVVVSDQMQNTHTSATRVSRSTTYRHATRLKKTSKAIQLHERWARCGPKACEIPVNFPLAETPKAIQHIKRAAWPLSLPTLSPDRGAWVSLEFTRANFTSIASFTSMLDCHCVDPSQPA